MQNVQTYYIAVPKEQAHFLYFILESNEGLCFYSTIEEDFSAGSRKIEVNFDISLKN